MCQGTENESQYQAADNGGNKRGVMGHKRCAPQ